MMAAVMMVVLLATGAHASCSQYSCSSCTSQSGCGWCSSASYYGVGTCMNGNSYGPSSGTCFSGSWAYFSTGCSCDSHTSCSTCTPNTCQWCTANAQCQSTYSTCSGARYVVPSQCSSGSTTLWVAPTITGIGCLCVVFSICARRRRQRGLVIVAQNNVVYQQQPFMQQPLGYGTVQQGGYVQQGQPWQGQPVMGYAIQPIA